jgi:hypothetical protein
MTLNEGGFASGRSSAHCAPPAAYAIVSIVEPARYPLIAGDYPKMAKWGNDAPTVIGRQGQCGTGFYR